MLEPCHEFLGPNNQLHNDEFNLSKGKNFLGTGSLQRNVQERFYVDFIVDKTNRPIIIHNSGSIPARLQLRNLQQLQIQNLKLQKSYQVIVNLSPLAKEELQWWIGNLQYSNGKAINSGQVGQVLIQTDASYKGLSAVCRGVQTGGQWSMKEKELHINALELLAVKLTLMTFTKMNNFKTIHFEIENITAL